MTSYANSDAEHVGRGIQLGGKGDRLDQALSEESEPLTVTRLERIMRPDLGDDPHDPAGRGLEQMGMCLISKTGDSYGLAARWFGWLPGHYDSREAALVAYGYVLGGESAGYLDRVAEPGPEPWTVQMIERFARG